MLTRRQTRFFSELVPVEITPTGIDQPRTRISIAPGIQIQCKRRLLNREEAKQLENHYRSRSIYAPAGLRPNPERHARDFDIKRPYYCGRRPEIIESTLVQMCQDAFYPTRILYRNPYLYKKIGSPDECHKRAFAYALRRRR